MRKRLPVNLWCVAPTPVFRLWFAPKVILNWSAILSWFVPVVIPAQTLTANFQLFLNTNITSRLLSGGLSEALLMIDEPGAARLNADGTASLTPTPFCVSPNSQSNSAPAATGGASNVPGLPVGGLFGTGTAPDCNPTVANQTYQQNTYTIFRGQPANAANGTANAAVVWPGVPVTPPGTNRTRTIRITNVRGNAAGVPASTSLVPTQIFSFLSISASQSLSLNNPQQAVAFVLPGLQFDVRTCAGSSSGIPRAWVQCVLSRVEVIPCSTIRMRPVRSELSSV